MSVVNLGGGSFSDYAAWTKTPAGQSDYAQWKSKLPATPNPFQTPYQPPAGWQKSMQAPAPKAPDMSAYNTPFRTPSGSPWNNPGVQQRPQAPSGFPGLGSALAPEDAARQSNTAWSQAWNDAWTNYRGPAPVARTTAQSYELPGANYRQRLGSNEAPVFTGIGNEGNYAYRAPGDRPNFFEQRSSDWTGGTAQTPDYTRRDAFINTLNDRLASYQRNSGVFQGDGRPPASWGGAPQFDIPSLWSQAGEAVRSGFSNPFALR